MTTQAPWTEGRWGGRLIVLAGRLQGEAVVRHGTLAMNTRQELLQAFIDYQDYRF